MLQELVIFTSSCRNFNRYSSHSRVPAETLTGTRHTPEFLQKLSQGLVTPASSCRNFNRYSSRPRVPAETLTGTRHAHEFLQPNKRNPHNLRVFFNLLFHRSEADIFSIK